MLMSRCAGQIELECCRGGLADVRSATKPLEFPTLRGAPGQPCGAARPLPTLKRNGLSDGDRKPR